MLQAQLRCLTPRDLVSGERRQVATTVRVKCTVTDRGRIVNLKQVQSCNPLRLRFFTIRYVSNCTNFPPRPTTNPFVWPAQLVESLLATPPPSWDPSSVALHPSLAPDLTAPPQTGVFCTKHFADMRLAEATPW